MVMLGAPHNYHSPLHDTAVHAQCASSIQYFFHAVLRAKGPTAVTQTTRFHCTPVPLDHMALLLCVGPYFQLNDRLQRSRVRLQPGILAHRNLRNTKIHSGATSCFDVDGICLTASLCDPGCGPPDHF